MTRGFTPSSIPSNSRSTHPQSVHHAPAGAPSSQLQAAINPHLPEISLKVHQLPSRALSYPKNCEIRYRPYTFGEIKKISQSKLSLKDSFYLVLSGIECSFDKLNLTMGDLLYIGLLRKLSTVGTSKVMVPYVCEVCKETNKEIISTDTIEFEELSIPDLPVRVSFSFFELEFTPLTIQRFMDLVDRKYETNEIAMLAAQVTNYEFDATLSAFQNCYGEDAQLLDEVDRILYHGVKAIPSKCQKCSNTVSIELDGGAALLLPFRESKITHENRIHFGTEAPHQSP